MTRRDCTASSRKSQGEGRLAEKSVVGYHFGEIMNIESRKVAERKPVPQDTFLANLLLEVDAKGKELAAAGHSNQEIALTLAQLLNEKAPFLQIIVQAGTVTISYTAEDENRPVYPSNA